MQVSTLELSTGVQRAFPGADFDFAPPFDITPTDVRLPFTEVKGGGAYLAVRTDAPYGSNDATSGIQAAYLLAPLSRPRKNLTIFAVEPHTKSLDQVADTAGMSAEALVLAGAVYMAAGRMARNVGGRVHLPLFALEDLASFTAGSRPRTVFLPPIALAEKGSAVAPEIPERLEFMRHQLGTRAVRTESRDTLLDNFRRGIEQRQPRG